MNSPDNAAAGTSFDPQPVAAAGGFEVRTGKRALMVAPGVPLRVPNLTLAEAMAEEWRAAGPQARMTDLRLARLAIATAEAQQDRSPIHESVLAYASTDLVCYWSGEGEPKPLRDAQASAWQPLLDWLAATHGVRLRPVFGIAPVDQDGADIARLKQVVAGLAPHELVALRFGTAASGSLVIGLALCAGAWTPDAAYEAATVDETFQMERWGRDAEAEQVLAARRADLATAARFLALWRGDGA